MFVCCRSYCYCYCNAPSNLSSMSSFFIAIYSSSIQSLTVDSSSDLGIGDGRMQKIADQFFSSVETMSVSLVDDSELIN